MLSNVNLEILLQYLNVFFFCTQDMVVLPYKDSVLLFSGYMQQLVMESLGTEFDFDGNRVI